VETPAFFVGKIRDSDAFYDLKLQGMIEGFHQLMLEKIPGDMTADGRQRAVLATQDAGEADVFPASLQAQAAGEQVPQAVKWQVMLDFQREAAPQEYVERGIPVPSMQQLLAQIQEQIPMFRLRGSKEFLDDRCGVMTPGLRGYTGKLDV
jgi:hypothetical protein